MPPRGGAPAGKNNTPGRRKKTDNQYFDLGKVGRKTGITLKDTGIRDEHGLEPVSGIFSSPRSAERNGERTLTSEGMEVQESSAPDVTATLTGRKPPRLPPPRQSTPRHTNIGSPKRMSSAKPARIAEQDDELDSSRAHTQPPANRRLDFAGPTNRSRTSIHVAETQSPFKPRKTLRRSNGPARPDLFQLLDDADDVAARTTTEHRLVNGVGDEEEDVEQSIEGDDGPLMMDDGDTYPVDIEATAASLEEEDAQTAIPSDSPLKRKRGRPRKSDQSLRDSQRQNTPPVAAMASSSSSKKRNRASMDNNENRDDSAASGSQGAMNPPQRKKRSSPAEVVIHRDEGDEVVDQSQIAYGDEYQVDEDSGVAPQDTQRELDSQLRADEGQTQRKGKGRTKGKGKAAAPKERDPNRAMQKKGSPVKLNDSPSKRLQRGGSLGPVSNVNLRAVTPFEDANHTTSRFGRNLIQPLKYWENESRIWKGGEIEGIVRAEHVEKSKPKSSKRRRANRRKGGRLPDIGEESETESILPDEWEDEMGVITGNVASWNPVTGEGDPDNPVQEDIAFAASSIVTRDVAGSDFKYAKIMTIPFFGAGVVELPPEGFKRAKNCRRMQMVFFVHEGKVMVEVGATGMEVNQFALSKGGVWVVPRGNNYAITNESRSTTAKVFFAQGCVVEAAE